MSIESSGISPMALPSVSSQQVPERAETASRIDASSRMGGETSSSQPLPAQSGSVDAEKLQAVVEKMNELMQNTNRSVKFSVDDSTERVVVKVLDLETDEVIRQIPSEETLKFSEFLEGMVGIIFDQKA